MNYVDLQYLTALNHVMANGIEALDRTGTKSVFGYQMRFDLSKGFPLITTKKVPFKSILSELLWFIEPKSAMQSSSFRSG